MAIKDLSRPGKDFKTVGARRVSKELYKQSRRGELGVLKRNVKELAGTIGGFRRVLKRGPLDRKRVIALKAKMKKAIQAPTRQQKRVVNKLAAHYSKGSAKRAALTENKVKMNTEKVDTDMNAIERAQQIKLDKMERAVEKTMGKGKDSAMNGKGVDANDVRSMEEAKAQDSKLSEGAEQVLREVHEDARQDVADQEDLITNTEEVAEEAVEDVPEEAEAEADDMGDWKR